MKKIEISIGELFNKLGINSIDEIETRDGLFIKTPSGEITPIKGFIKKSPKNIYEYSLENGIKIKCSDEHLFQEKGITKKARECESIDTVEKTLNIIDTKFVKKDYVYDISIDAPHLYVTPNGVIHHNTSLVTAIIEELDADVLWINGSGDAGIDTFRSKVKDFVTSVSIDDSPKIVVVDEADGISREGQKNLRALIETFSKHSTFIFTCNYKEQLIEPLRNRFIHFDFDSLYNQNKKDIGMQIYKRLQFILENEKIQYNPKDLGPIIQNMYPSVRKMVLTLQQSVQDNVLEIDESMINLNTKYSEILELVKGKKFIEVRKKLQDLDEPGSFYSFIFKNLDDWFKPEAQPHVILLCAKYQDMHERARDKQINTAAFCTEVMLTPGIEFI